MTANPCFDTQPLATSCHQLPPMHPHTHLHHVLRAARAVVPRADPQPHRHLRPGAIGQVHHPPRAAAVGRHRLRLVLWDTPREYLSLRIWVGSWVVAAVAYKTLQGTVRLVQCCSMAEAEVG